MQRLEDYGLLGIRQQRQALDPGPSLAEARELVERSRAARAAEVVLRVKLRSLDSKSPPAVVPRRARGAKADVALGRSGIEYRSSC